MDEEFVREIFASQGDVRIRRMFGGYGIYADGLIVVLVLRGELLLKGDDETASFFPEAGCRRQIYERLSRRPVAMPYYSFPLEAFDDPEIMTIWAARAREAAGRAALRKANAVRRRSRSA